MNLTVRGASAAERPKQKGRSKKKLTNQQALFGIILVLLLILVTVIVALLGDKIAAGPLNLGAAGLTLFGLSFLAFVDVQTIWWRDDQDRVVTPEMERKLSNLRPVGHMFVIVGAVMLVGYFMATSLKNALFLAVLIYAGVVAAGLIAFLSTWILYIKPKTIVFGCRSRYIRPRSSTGRQR